jgi:hypothetical protein
VWSVPWLEKQVEAASLFMPCRAGPGRTIMGRPLLFAEDTGHTTRTQEDTNNRSSLASLLVVGHEPLHRLLDGCEGTTISG